MASSREERMQQRLRGAQKREVADVDFGLTFPAFGSKEGEDELATPDAKLIRKTPQRESREQTPRLNERSAKDAVVAGNMRDGNGNEGSSSAGANISAKRRRLDVDRNIGKQKGEDKARGAERNAERVVTAVVEEDVKMTRRRPVLPSKGGADGDEIYALVEETDELELTQEQNTSMMSGGSTVAPATRSTASPTSLRSSLRIPKSSPAPTAALEEIVESPTDAPGSGHRIRSSGGRETVSSTHQLESSLINATPTPIPRDGTNSTSASKKRKRATGGTQLPKTASRTRRRLSRQAEAEEDDIDELSPEQPKPQRRKILSAGRESFSEDEGRVSREIDEEADELEEAEAITDKEAAIQLKKNRRRRVSQESPVLDEVSLIPPKASKKQTGRPRKLSSPADQRQPKPASNKSLKKSKPPSGKPIPVTVHRLTHGPVYDEEESDADILNSEIPHARRGGVNAVDVLSQICQEIIAAGLDSLEQNGAEIEDRKVRREYRTKWKAVEIFGMEMGTRLVEHTINLDNVYSLEKRVRDEHRKKLGLRDEILRIRAEREQVALRMDAVRIKHERESNAVQDRDSLNNTVHDIEVAVERGKEKNGRESPAEDDKTGIELLLKRIAGEVSSNSDEGGMLKRIKDFNAFLERTAGALEGRR